MLLLPQFSSVLGNKGFARKPLLGAIKLAIWRTVIFRRSTLAETEPFAIYSESKNLYSSVRFRPIGERKKAVARRSQRYYFLFLHLSFWFFDSCAVKGRIPE